MKRIKIISAKPILIIGVLSEKIIPGIKYETSGIVVPIVINPHDKDVTGRLIKICDPMMFTMKNEDYDSYYDDNLKLESPSIINSSNLIKYNNDNIMTIRRYDITKPEYTSEGMEYCKLDIEYDDINTFSTVITKSITETGIDIISHNYYFGTKEKNIYSIEDIVNNKVQKLNCCKPPVCNFKYEMEKNIIRILPTIYFVDEHNQTIYGDIDLGIAYDTSMYTKNTVFSRIHLTNKMDNPRSHYDHKISADFMKYNMYINHKVGGPDHNVFILHHGAICLIGTNVRKVKSTYYIDLYVIEYNTFKYWDTKKINLIGRSYE